MFVASKSGLENKQLYAFGSFRLDVAERRLLNDGRVVPLTIKIFDLLLVMVEAAGHLKSREELVEAVWPDTIVEEHSLTSRMSALRKALGDEGETPRYIETVRGRGYRFIATVTVEGAVQAHDAKAPGASPHRLTIAAAAVAIVVGAGLLAWRFLGAPAESTVRAIPPRSIAVLPFANLSADPANAYFASGIQDMILTKLAGIGDLRVISRTSTEKYPSRPDDLRKLGEQFGVATILEGSVQKVGAQVLINVQLIDARSDDHLWAQAYTRPMDNILDVESDVATQVASALKARLQPAEAKRLANVPTRNGPAYDLFLQAEFPALQVEEGGSSASVEMYERAASLYTQALERDPDFALAKARLSFLQSYAAWFGVDTTPGLLEGAERLAQSALPSGLPQAYLALGYVYYWGHRDYAKALEQFMLAEQSLPNDASVSSAIAFISRRQGKWQEALTGLQQAQLHDPRNSLWFAERGNTLAQLRRYAEAQQEYGRALSVDPQNVRVMAYKAMTHLFAGEPQQAIETLDRAPAGVDTTGVVSTARFRAALLGRRPDQALAALATAGDDWVEESFKSTVPAHLLRARAWSLKGDQAHAHDEYEKSLALLQRSLAEQPDNFNVLSTLGATSAGLGRKDEAVRAGRRATELIPVASDAVTGASQLASLAETYAQLGEASPAVDLLRQLLDMPAGNFVSIATLRTDPGWDRIREDASFKRLLADHERGGSHAGTHALAPALTDAR